MGCQEEVIIGEIVSFSICTHNPEDGASSDADEAPLYRIYGDDPVPLATGVLERLDSSNTTGFYGSSTLCSEEAGFEAGRAYELYIQATVNSHTGAIAYTFTVTNYGYMPVAGAVEWPYQLVDTVGGPISGGDVWIATDPAGTHVVWRGQTDAFGYARDIYNQQPFLKPGIYYFLSYRQGYVFNLPDMETVTETLLGSKPLAAAAKRVSGQATGESAGSLSPTLSSVGPQPVEWPFCLRTAEAKPISGAVVQISADENGQRIIWRGKTDASGYARDSHGQHPSLIPGVWFFWSSHGSYRFSRPSREIITPN